MTQGLSLIVTANMDERSECQSYLKSKVNPLFQDMVADLLDIKPGNPIPFLVSWLQERTGSSLSLAEKEELRSLRKEVKALKGASHRDSGSEDSAEEEFAEDVKVVQKKHRKEVSSEAFGTFNKAGNFAPKTIAKTASQRQRILARLSKAFLFNTLDPAATEVLVQAMEERKFAAGDKVITQGDEGDALYIVDAGKLECAKAVSPQDPPTVVMTYSVGDSFGELALLYNTPRAATVTASTACTLWSLDRSTFAHVAKSAAISRRTQYEALLKKVELLQTMTDYERLQLTDALKTVTFADSEFVMREGDWGEVFYIVESGAAKATKTITPNTEPILVKEYRPGDYFGELALLDGEPRAASVIAVGDLRCVVMDRLAFKRLLGPVETILRRNAAKYAEVLERFRQ